MKFFLALLAGASVVALPVATAHGQDAAPTPCTGMVITDPAKDQIVYPNPGVGFAATATPGPENLDARGVFFNYVMKDGKPSLTANIQVTNLAPDLPSPGADTGSVEYYLDFAPAVGDVSWVQATSDGTAFTYSYGLVQRLPDGTGTVATEEATTGKAFLGPMGVLQIDIPLEESAAKVGTKFEGLALSIAGAYYAPSDDAPDEGLKTYTVTECPAAPAASGDQPSQEQPQQQQPPQQQPQQPQQQPSQQQPQQQPQGGAGLLPVSGPLTASFAVDKGKRKTAVKRGLRARVRCSVQCNVAAVATIDKRTARKLKLGKKAITIGKGRAAIKKAGRIPFYVKLTKKAKRALKRKGVRKFSVKVKFTVTDTKGQQLKTGTKKSTLR